MKRHFVTFYSPGTLFAETTTMEIKKWDIELAVEMSKGVIERYNAVPYGFKFTTRERKMNELDSKQVKQSCFYYLGGDVFTLKQLKELNDPHNDTLIRNMECNNWEKVVINSNSWKWTQPLEKGDVVLKKGE